MIEELQEKIGIIKDFYKGNSARGLSEGAKYQLKAIENKIAELDLKSNMADNPLISQLLETVKAKVANTEKTLRTQKVKNEADILEREMLFNKLEWYKQELNMFVDTEEAFKQINIQLDNWIKKLK